MTISHHEKRCTYKGNMIKGIPLYDGKSESKEKEEFGGIDIHDPSDLYPLPSNQKCYFSRGGSIAQLLAHLLPHPNAPGSIPIIPKKFKRKKFIKVDEVIQWPFLPRRQLTVA